YRTEWWYMTGLLDTPAGMVGIQVTFFRVRTPIDPAHPSGFAAPQLIIAHAAIADPARGSLLKDERVARAGFGLVGAAEHDTDVRLDGWRLRRTAAGTYEAVIPARGFTLTLIAQPTQPLLLQGEAGFSRKGPQPQQASHYYSQPHLQLAARIERDGTAIEARGSGWFDHEWSTEVLDDTGAGWDWIGMNLDDGSALTAFQVRRRGGGAAVHTYALLRAAGGATRVFGGSDVRFEPLTRWNSPRTRADWPVAQRITVGSRAFETRPLMPDQELDSRASTGAVYWEGASLLLDGGRRVGRGYLEMTGYLAPIVL
ncbi:MAG: lipocalin-like domain-containing protein, partial [Betaproteobacteria bacterium]